LTILDVLRASCAVATCDKLVHGEALNVDTVRTTGECQFQSCSHLQQ
jgi:hypothetical protein